MKAVVMKGPKTSVIEELEKPVINENQVLIKLKYVGVCMSEHHDWSTAHEGQAFGHEPMGVIIEIGKQVMGFQIGDRVSGLWGSTLPGAGGMVEFQAVDPRHSTIIKIPDHVKSEDAILEPLSCLLSAVSKLRAGVPGDWVCVVGCGYMGCGAISLLKHKGFRIAAVDIRKTSLADAKTYGADEIYTPEEALEKFSKKGFSLVMEWGETNESIDTAIHLTATCGQLCIGAYHTGGKRLIDMQQLNVKAIDCLSTHPREADLSSSCARNAMELLSNGSWNFKSIPTMIYPMSQFDRAQQELETKYGHHMKALIDMERVDGDSVFVK